MANSSNNCVEVKENLFKDVKYYITGEVDDKIENLLRAGGAEKQNYFLDYVTHLIVGKDYEENDIADANDVYEKPAITPDWVVMCARLKRLVSITPYIFRTDKLFSDKLFCFSQLAIDKVPLWGMVRYHGGTIRGDLTSSVDYLVTYRTDSPKYKRAFAIGADDIKIVTPDFVVESIRAHKLLDPVLFHPSLIKWPAPVKVPEPTTIITGFEPEMPENNESTKPSDPTQVKLEQLKQRMPWNQPVVVSSSSSATDPVAPPNVIAPSFRMNMQLNQKLFTSQMGNSQSGSVMSNFTPATVHMQRSTIHHTPNSQQNQQPNLQTNSLNINSLIGQGNRPGNLHPLRGTVTQQLLQQQQQQQQQNRLQQSNIQRAAAAPGNMNQQQLLQQHVNTNQRLTVLQNQLINQQNLLNQQAVGANQDNRNQDPLLESPGQNNAQFNTGNLQQGGDVLHQRGQVERSPSQMTSPQHNQQSQMLSPQHQMQQQNQMTQQQLIQQQQQQQQQLLGQQQQQQQNPLLQQQSQSNQQLMQQNDLQTQLLGQQSSQNQPGQQIIQQHTQSVIQQNQIQLLQQQQQQQQNQQIMQQNVQGQPPQMCQQQTGPIIRQGPLINAQNQQIINQPAQQPNQQLLGLPPNHHLSQLNPQQLQQLQQLKREQQQLLNQNPVQMGQQNLNLNQQNVAVNQQNLSNSNSNQGQNQQLQQSMQLSRQQQQLIQQNRGQNFNQTILNQHLVNQKQQQQQQQQLFNQQQINTSQHQQMLQNQQNLTNQPQFVNQAQFDPMQQQQQQQQQKLAQGQMNQMNVQSLTQQLQQQNLGQQLNQQLMQQNQQGNSLNQGLGLEQNLGMANQQQIGPGIAQQVVRSAPQFAQQQQQQQQQQVLINQGQQGGPQRAQLSQQIWAQQQQQQQQQQVQGGAPVQGQQIIRHPVNVAVQQSPGGSGPNTRIQWPPGQQPGVPQRQLIHLDAQTHHQLQKMPPEQQAMFVAKLQRQQRQMQYVKQLQQRAGNHIVIRGNVPQGLTTQQQMQWLQQQAKQQGIVLPPNIQQNLTPGNVVPPPNTAPVAAVPSQHAPGLSPINQAPAAPQAQQFVTDQAAPHPLQLKQQQYRLQQLQLQREQAQKNALVQQGGMPPQAVARPQMVPTPVADSTTNSQAQVNPKTKTALAELINGKMQGRAPVRPEGMPEPSAAGTLRMMTAQHQAAINSKPQEIIALHQRRVISGPNGEIIKPPGVTGMPINTPNEAAKLQYNQKVSVPVQHRTSGPYYGHNPNLKLPPDLFLLGCIFVVVEVEDYLEENFPGWQQKIEKHGGEVEKQYCAKVTHVICETQRHGVVMQALRDMKRCVTIRWLSDVIKRKQVTPPWTALHLPQIYMDITPASKHLISISGFEGNVRQMVKQMVMYTGAKWTNYFSKHNTVLICAKPEGKKYNHAKKWGTPVVNVQWLTEIMLGNFAALNQMDNQAYQTYSSPPNLSFDPKLVPNMMHAWKAAINISQESYERVKRSASPVSLPKVKRRKIEHVDENENITDQPLHSDYRILFSQFETSRLKELEKIVRELGGIVAKDHSNFTHLVVPKLGRTAKLLFAVVKSCPIVSEGWLERSAMAKSFVALGTEFHLPTGDLNRTYNVSFEQTLQRNRDSRNKLFADKSFWVTPSVVPNRRTVCELIELSGGVVERIRRSRAQIEMTAPNTYFILTTKEDLHLVADLLKNKKDKHRVVYNVELVLNALLKQTFELDGYAVSVV